MTDFTFTVKRSDYEGTMTLLEDVAKWRPQAGRQCYRQGLGRWSWYEVSRRCMTKVFDRLAWRISISR